MFIGQWIRRLSDRMRSSTSHLLGWLSGDGLSVLVLLLVVATTGLGVLVYCGWGWILSNSELLRNLALVVLGAIGLPLAIWRSTVAHIQAQTAHKQVQMSEQNLLNERYQKGVEMLGGNTLSAHVAGIHILDSLARELPEKYHIRIMNLFLDFLRRPPESTEKARIETDYDADPDNIGGYLPQASPDVQAIITAIGLRSDRQIEVEDREEWRINLDGVNLSGVSFRGNFRGASLNGADLSCAKLTEVDFTRTEIYQTNFYDVDVSAAEFWSVKGLFQDTFDLCVFIWDNAAPPMLHLSYSAQTGEPLIWQGEVRPRPEPEE